MTKKEAERKTVRQKPKPEEEEKDGKKLGETRPREDR